MTTKSMSYTPERIAKIRQREADTPDALKRNPLNNYTEGWFHVTLNVRDESPVLGFITGRANASEESNDAPRCALSSLGKSVEQIWQTVDKYHPMCRCEALQVMPEHIHALLRLLPGNQAHLGRIVNGLMIGCTHAYWDTLGIPWQQMREEKDAVASSPEEEKALRSLWQDKDHTHSRRGPALFVRGYNDVEALTAEEIDIKRQYIHDNPRKRLVASTRPDCFRVVRNQQSPNWTLTRAMNAVAADFWIRRDTQTCRRLQDNVSRRLQRMPGTPDILALDYVGCRSLLAAPRKVSLICHRADATAFSRQKEAVLQAAREGAVVVSAFISPKERDIMKLLMQEQLPLIEVMDNGFGTRYKPSGRAFYSTAENHHVQISCWTYVYQDSRKTPSTLSREMCLVMNELVRLITGVPDDRWK